MSLRKNLNYKRLGRKKRVRANIRGNALKPRLSIFRSHTHIYAQLIDDLDHRTLVSVSTLDIKKGGKKSDSAKAVGEAIAKKAIAMGVKKAVFDRGSYRYHGRVKALADGARANGLEI